MTLWRELRELHRAAIQRVERLGAVALSEERRTGLDGSRPSRRSDLAERRRVERRKQRDRLGEGALRRHGCSISAAGEAARDLNAETQSGRTRFNNVSFCSTASQKGFEVGEPGGRCRTKSDSQVETRHA